MAHCDDLMFVFGIKIHMIFYLFFSGVECQKYEEWRLEYLERYTLEDNLQSGYSDSIIIRFHRHSMLYRNIEASC